MKGHLRLGCDLTYIFLVIDEYTEIENESGCREMIDMAIDALENPRKPRPEGEIPSQVFPQILGTGYHDREPAAQRHFEESFKAYLDSLLGAE